MLNNSSVLSSMTFLRNRSYTTQLLSVFNANGQNRKGRSRHRVKRVVQLHKTPRVDGGQKQHRWLLGTG